MTHKKALKQAQLLARKTGITHYVTFIRTDKFDVISEKKYYSTGSRSEVIAAFD